MIRSTFFCCCLAGLSPVLAQAPRQALAAAPVNPWKAAAAEIPLAVQRAKVLSQSIGRGQAGPESQGGDLVVQLIERPVLPVAPPPPVGAARVGPPLSLAEIAARRAAQPDQLRLFSPTIAVCPGGVSHLRWSTVDAKQGWREYAAFVLLDLSAASACGDFMEGRTRYLLMPTVAVATPRQLEALRVPKAAQFQQPEDIILTSGDPTNEAALAPLRAFLAKYQAEAELIASTFAARKADQAARLKWEGENPAPKQDMVVRFWPLDAVASQNP